MKLGLIGGQIDYSLSPKIHLAALDELRMEGSYQLLPTRSEDLHETLDQLFRDGFQGLNITNPFKYAVIQYCENISSTVKIIQSANTLIRGEKGWIADSTDGFGLQFALKPWNLSTIDRNALILGGGGFARASTLELLQNNWHVAVSMRHFLPEWKGLCARYPDLLSIHSWVDRVALGQNSSLVVNATPIGSDGVSSPFPFNLLPLPGSYYLESIYSPIMTSVMKLLIESGSTVQNGLRILLGQAMSSFSIWTDRAFPEESLRQLEIELCCAI